jgi:hypothetical protein
MTNEYIVPGTSSKEISVFIENDSNIKEGNEDYFTYPENLYTLLLQRKDVSIEFTKPTYINIKTYNYEWIRTFNLFFMQLFIQLSKECNKNTCLDMTAGKEWQFLCVQHGKNQRNVVQLTISHIILTKQ